jgi:hypothetical protein
MVNVNGKSLSFINTLFPEGYMGRTDQRGVDKWYIRTRFYIKLRGDVFPICVSDSESEVRLRAACAGYDVEAMPTAYRTDGVIGPSPDYYYAIKKCG